MSLAQPTANGGNLFEVEAAFNEKSTKILLFRVTFDIFLGLERYAQLPDSVFAMVNPISNSMEYVPMKILCSLILIVLLLVSVPLASAQIFNGSFENFTGDH